MWLILRTPYWSSQPLLWGGTIGVDGFPAALVSFRDGAVVGFGAETAATVGVFHGQSAVFGGGDAGNGIGRGINSLLVFRTIHFGGGMFRPWGVDSSLIERGLEEDNVEREGLEEGADALALSGSILKIISFFNFSLLFVVANGGGDGVFLVVLSYLGGGSEVLMSAWGPFDSHKTAGWIFLPPIPTVSRFPLDFSACPNEISQRERGEGANFFPVVWILYETTVWLVGGIAKIVKHFQRGLLSFATRTTKSNQLWMEKILQSIMISNLHSPRAIMLCRKDVAVLYHICLQIPTMR